MQLSPRTAEILLNLAADLIQRNLAAASGISIPNPPIFPDDPELMRPAGCFVSLHDQKTHNLRGCIGILDSEKPLRETLAAAAHGVLKDPRFVNQPVTPQEIGRLELEVTVLDPMRPVPTPLDFDPNQHGIFLTIAGRSGCFLPQVARETGWSREQLLARLCSEKLGLPSTAWRNSDATLKIFQAQVIGPRLLPSHI